MRWKLKTTPIEGDERVRYRFAWFPTKVEDHVIWLENYWTAEVYQFFLDSDFAGSRTEWIETRRGLCDNYC